MLARPDLVLQIQIVGSGLFYKNNMPLWKEICIVILEQNFEAAKIMNKALKALKEANPSLFAQFMELLTEDLGLAEESIAGRLECPACHNQFQIALNRTVPSSRSRGKGRASMNVKRKRVWNPKRTSLFSRLVTLAKIRKTTTGGVNAEFNRVMRGKVKGLPPPEVREIKMKWVNGEIAKSKNRAA
jgi:hypothetical protein